MATTTKTAPTDTAAPARRMFPTRNDIPAETRGKLVDLLNRQLAATHDVRTQTKHCHWNVKGPNFYSLHLLFDKLAADLGEHVDTIGERVTALGGLALGTARMVAASSCIPEFPLDVVESHDLLNAICDRYKALGKSLRDGIDAADDLGDKDTADLFTEVSRAVDQYLYFLEAHLQA